MPVLRLHLLCIMMNTDPGIISFRWIKTILKAFCIQRKGFPGPGQIGPAPQTPTSVTSCHSPVDLRQRWLNRESSFIRFARETESIPSHRFPQQGIAVHIISTSVGFSVKLTSHSETLNLPTPQNLQRSMKNSVIWLIRLSRCLMLSKRCMLLTDGTFLPSTHVFDIVQMQAFERED